MRRSGSHRALLLLAALAGCGSQDLTDTPSFESARLEPGSSFVVLLGMFADAFIATPEVVVITTGPSSETPFNTICGLTPSYSSPMAPVPALAPPGVAGVSGAIRLYSEQPIPPGTRLELTYLCTGGAYATFRAVVIQEPQ